jgi:hypothetical protein
MPVPDNAKRRKSLAAVRSRLGYDRVAGGINCPVEVCPLAGDPDMFRPPAMIGSDAGAHGEAADSKWAHSAAPAPNGDVVHRQAAFRHHFFQVAVAKRVPQIPPHAQNDNHVLEVSPPKQ